MKAVTVYQPWASLIAVGAKRFETRGWKTNYRGPIAIHAGKKKPPEQEGFAPGTFQPIVDAIVDGLGHWRCDWDNAPLGAVIATAELVECYEVWDNNDEEADVLLFTGDWSTATDFIHIGKDTNEYLFGDFSDGRFAWELANVKLLPAPIPTRGYQNLWNWNGRTMV